MEGRGHHDIARLRGTSTRTVANQLSTVFRKLGVSGRAQAVDRLAARSISGIAEKPETLSPVSHVSDASSAEGKSERSFAPKGFSQSGFFDRSGAGAAGVALGTGTAPDAAGDEPVAAPGAPGADDGLDFVKPLAASGDDSRAATPRPFSPPERAASRGTPLPLAATGRDPGMVGSGAGSTAGFSTSRSGDAGARVSLAAGAFAGAKDWIAK
jgi:hypothetical protein